MYLDLDKIVNSQAVYFADSANLDAANRLRTSELTTLLALEHLHDKQPLLVDEVLNGSATSTHSTTTSSVLMETSLSGDYAIRQTWQRYHYQTGKSQYCIWTFTNFESLTNIEKRVGYFSSSTSAPYTADLDGFFLMSDSTGISINIYRTGTLVEQKYQTGFNIDKLDGKGISGESVDWSKGQILLVDFLWLGFGRIRWGLDIDGEYVWFHESKIANIEQDVFMSSPNQPVRYEIRQTGAGEGNFKQVCSSVNSEGAQNLIGKVLSNNSGVNDIQANTTGNRYAVHGTRLKTTHLDASVDILSYDYISETNDRALWEVWLNPTIGAGTFNYSDQTNSAVQTAIGNQTAGTPPLVSGGQLLDSGHVSGNSQINVTIDSSIKIGVGIDGTRDEIVYTVTPLQNGLDLYIAGTRRELT